MPHGVVQLSSTVLSTTVQVCCLWYSLVPAVLAHPAGGANVARYTLTTTPVGGYQLSAGNTGWLHYTPPYIMPTPITAVCLSTSTLLVFAARC